jgi:hypothetical protein
MAKKPVRKSTRASKRKPPVRLPMPFDDALGGILAMTPATAKKVNKKVADKRKKIDGR